MTFAEHISIKTFIPHYHFQNEDFQFKVENLVKKLTI